MNNVYTYILFKATYYIDTIDNFINTDIKNSQ